MKSFFGSVFLIVCLVGLIALVVFMWPAIAFIFTFFYLLIGAICELIGIIFNLVGFGIGNPAEAIAGFMIVMTAIMVIGMALGGGEKKEEKKRWSLTIHQNIQQLRACGFAL